MNDEIAVALIAGLKELLAINAILATFPVGEARDALEARRCRIALKYGAQREPFGVFAAAYLFVVGGLLLTAIALLVLGGDAGAWASLFQSLLVGLGLAGLLLALFGIVLAGFGVTFRIRDWWSGRDIARPTDAPSDPDVESACTSWARERRAHATRAIDARRGTSIAQCPVLDPPRPSVRGAIDGQSVVVLVFVCRVRSVRANSVRMAT